MSPEDGAPNQRELLARALRAVDDARRRLDAFESAAHEPLAILGAGCRLPGGVESPEAFWEHLRAGVDFVGPMPADHYDAEAWYDADPATPGKIAAKDGAFVEDVAGFDPLFFGMSPREAAFVDPQQRLLLEVTWRALEHANLDPRSLRGTKTGVFVGISTADYLTHLIKNVPWRDIAASAGTGGSHSAAAGRLSFTLGLEGPALVVNTACSSSLVALHLAAQSLRRGECDTAIVAGVNLVLAPLSSLVFSQARMLAPDGRCKTFDATADGYGRGEGAVAMVLRRAGDAQQEGRDVLAEVAGTAVNQDGASGGLTAPNGPAQSAVIHAALADGRLAPGDIDAIEAHGTGTPLGDPIEIGALERVFAEHHTPERPLYVSSVKTNLGHLEAAAGLVGVLKAVLQLRQRELAPHLHFSAPSPHVPWERLPFVVPTEGRPWTRSEGRRACGVSSFGFSGTNAHVILREAVAREPVTAKDTPQVIVLSAQDAERLRAQARTLGEGLAAAEAPALSEVAAALGTGRALLPHRAAFVAADRNEAQARLHSLACGEGANEVFQGHITGRPETRLRFACPPPAAGLARTLADIAPALPWLEAAPDPEGNANLQAFRAQCALGRGWQALGLVPVQLVGAGLGELCAAVLAGVLDDDAAAALLRGNPVEASRLAPPRAPLHLASQPGRAPRDPVDGDALRRGLAADAPLPEPDAADTAPAATLRLELGGDDPHRSLLERAARGLVDGLPVRREVLFPKGAAGTARLPVHPFHRRRCWVDGPGLAPFVDGPREGHALFGPLAADSGKRSQSTQASLGPESPRFLAARRRGGHSIASHALAVEALLFAAAPAGDTVLLEDLEFADEPVIPSPVLLRLERRGLASGMRDLDLAIEGDGGSAVTWACGRATNADLPRIAESIESWSPDPALLESVRERIEASSLSAPEARAALSDLGHDAAGRLCGHVALPPSRHAEAARFRLHPLLLDATLLAANAEERLHRIRRITVTGAFGPTLAFCITEQDDSLSLQLASPEGDALMSLEGLELAARGLPLPSFARRGRFLAMEWITASDATRAASPGTWIVTGRDPESVGALVNALSDAGSSALAVPLDHLESALADAPRSGVVWVAASDRCATPDTLRDTIAECAQIIATAAGATEPPRVVLASGPEADDADPAVSAWLAVGRVAALEHPELAVRRIVNRAGFDALARELLSDDDEDEVRLGDGERRVSRLVLPRLTRRRDPAPVRGTWLVTGGLGALGRRVGPWLLERGAARVVLASRRSPDDATRAALHEASVRLEGQLETATLDVADPEAVNALVSRLADESIPLRGVVHAAGVLADGILADFDGERLDAVLDGKLRGAWNLDAATQKLPLDHFVLFSSSVALLGNAGQAAYAAANASLAGLAQKRRRSGHPALAIAWGPWAEGGMAARTGATRLERAGVRALAPEEALRALDELLVLDHAELGVLDVDWARFAAALPVGVRMPRLAERLPSSDEDGDQPSARALGEELASLDPEERSVRLAAWLRAAVAEALRLDAADVAADRPLAELGLDSLTGLELRNRIHAELGTRLGMRELVTATTIEALVTLLVPTLTTGGGLAEVDAALLAEIEALSDEEAAERLSRDDAHE